MKKIVIIIVSFISIISYSQGFSNGSFESTTSAGCDYNNGVATFNSKMDNVVMFSGWEVDIVENGCYIPSIPEGIKAIAIAADPTGADGADAVNIELTEPLVTGLNYTLTFWSFSNSSRPRGDIEIGCTEDETVMGTIIETVVTTIDTWVEHTVDFTAPNNATHISVRNQLDETFWNFIDDFSIELACTPLTVTVSDESICFGDEVTLTATGIGTITWDGGVVNGVAFTPAAAGTFTYNTISDSGEDCPHSVTIAVLEIPTISYTTTDEIYGSDGEIDINVIGISPFTYDWDTDGTGDFDDTQDLTGLTAGTYIIVVKDASECENTETIILNSQVGVVENTINIAVYPNPTSEFVTIAYNGAFTYEITSLNGDILISGIANKKETVAVNNLASGIYFVSIYTGETAKTVKIIKN